MLTKTSVLPLMFLCQKKAPVSYYLLFHLLNLKAVKQGLSFWGLFLAFLWFLVTGSPKEII